MWAKNFSGLKTFWPITLQDSSGPPTCRRLFRDSKDALQHRLLKSGFAKCRLVPPNLPDLYHPNIQPQTLVSSNFYLPNNQGFKSLNYTQYLNPHFPHLPFNFPFQPAVSVPHSSLAPKRPCPFDSPWPITYYPQISPQSNQPLKSQQNQYFANRYMLDKMVKFKKG